MKLISIIIAALFSSSVFAKSAAPGDYLVKFQSGIASNVFSLTAAMPMGTQIEDLGVAGWARVKLPAESINSFSVRSLRSLPGVLKVQPNYKIKLLENPALTPAKVQEILAKVNAGFPGGDAPAQDNPEIPMNGSGGSGADPLFGQQWGMQQMGVQSAWSATKGNPDVVVAVIDTGVDYTHEDLVDNMWRNPLEIAGNGVDDDNNGYVDDIVGWDFVSKDNKPYDLYASMFDMLMGGGNPGHGTHVAGCVAARSDNGKGIAGVAPNVRIMALRFISEKGQGTTADAISAIKYAVANGAKVTNNSWGSEGDDPNDPDTNALKDAIAMAQQAGVLFIAAAGNGHQGVGYNNDTDAKPAVPASYTNANIISVAAIDANGALGSFSNWGAVSVDLGAPGVKVLSTVAQPEKYSDTVIDIPGLITATWDGTSMAAPHVAGAAALYWSANPDKSWVDVKNAIIQSVKRTNALQGKSVSGGVLDVQNMMRF